MTTERVTRTEVAVVEVAAAGEEGVKATADELCDCFDGGHDTGNGTCLCGLPLTKVEEA